MEGARIEFHLRNESGEIAMVGNKIRRNPIVQDEFPLEGEITSIVLNNPVNGTEAGIMLDNEFSIPLQQVGNFELVFSESSYLPKRPSISELLDSATGNKK